MDVFRPVAVDYVLGWLRRTRLWFMLASPLGVCVRILGADPGRRFDPVSWPEWLFEWVCGCAVMAVRLKPWWRVPRFLAPKSPVLD